MRVKMRLREYWDRENAAYDAGRLVNQICKKLKKGMSVTQIAEAVEEDEARVQEIVDVSQKYAPDYDVEKIVQELL